MSLGKVGFIGRFKPLHLGASALLESLCEKADEVTIGIGSSNKYNLRNPFTAEESEKMIDIFLSPRFSNYKIMHVPDFGHVPEYSDGKRWKKEICDAFGKLDYFVSGNDYVRSLLGDKYRLMCPFDAVPEEKQVRLRATRVRLEMARGEGWRGLVPTNVAKYLNRDGLVERFRKEFGLQTLASLAGSESCLHDEDSRQEKMHVEEA